MFIRREMMPFFRKIVLLALLFPQPITPFLITDDGVQIQSWKYLDEGQFQLNARVDGLDTTITTTEKLKSGGTGTVYKAIRSNSKVTNIAVKLVDLTKDVIGPSLLTKALSHHNINRVHNGFHWNDGRVNWQVITMDLVNGGDLEDYLLAEEMDLANDQIRSIFLQAAGAIQYAHAHHVYHFHSKPLNIVLEGDGGEIKLVDFDTVYNHTMVYDHRAPS